MIEFPKIAANLPSLSLIEMTGQFVASELGEREPSRNLHGVLVRGNGAAAQDGNHRRNDQNC